MQFSKTVFGINGNYRMGLGIEIGNSQNGLTGNYQSKS